MLLALALLLASLLLPLFYSTFRYRERINAALFRTTAPALYRTAQLSDGVTAYQQNDDGNKHTIVVIHGGSLGSIAFLPFANELRTLGHNVIVYDGYGRGYSDRLHDQPITMALLVRQLLELLDHLGRTKRVVLYGSSLGGAVAAAFAARHPERVAAIGFEAPVVGSPTLRALSLLRLPLVGAWLARVLLVPMAIQRGENIGIDEAGRAAAKHFVEQFAVIGHRNDLVSLLLNDAITGDRMADHAAVAALDLPVHFAYALDDHECPRDDVEAAIALHKNATVRAYTGGHFFTNGRHAELAREFAQRLVSVKGSGRRRSSSPARRR